MNLFNSILEKLGIRSAGAANAPDVSQQPAPAPASEIDVVSKLEGLAASHAEKLN